MTEKKLSLKDIEEAARGVGLGNYPKYCGNGLYAIAPGLWGGKKALELFNQEILNSISNDKDYNQ